MTHAGLLAKPVNLKRELDLVAVGTVADMAPLAGDNRLLVKFGLDVMGHSPKEWLKSFFRRSLVFSRSPDQFASSISLSYRGSTGGRCRRRSRPRLSATENQAEADELLEVLDWANRQRQELEDDTIRESIARIEAEGLSDKRTLVLHKEDWPIGVIGIAAQKLAENFNKPCIMFTRSDGTWKRFGQGVFQVSICMRTVSTLSPRC